MSRNKKMSSLKDVKFTRAVQHTWIRAMKSGRYRKCDMELHSVTDEGHAYCALGVLGRVCGIATRELDEAGSILEDSKGTYLLPDSVQDRIAGINDACDGFDEVIRYVQKLKTVESVGKKR